MGLSDSLWSTEVCLHEVITGKLIYLHLAQWPQKAVIGLDLQLVFHLKRASANIVQGWKEIGISLLQDTWKYFGFVFIVEKLKTKQEDKALLSLRHFHLIFGWFTVTWWHSRLLKILYCIFSLPFKKEVLTPFWIIINTSFLLWNQVLDFYLKLLCIDFTLKRKKQIRFSTIVFSL